MGLSKERGQVPAESVTQRWPGLAWLSRFHIIAELTLFLLQVAEESSSQAMGL